MYGPTRIVWASLTPRSLQAADPNGAFVRLNRTADYVVQWLLGAKRVHGLHIDFVGLWSESTGAVESLCCASFCPCSDSPYKRECSAGQ